MFCAWQHPMCQPRVSFKAQRVRLPFFLMLKFHDPTGTKMDAGEVVIPRVAVLVAHNAVTLCK